MSEKRRSAPLQFRLVNSPGLEEPFKQAGLSPTSDATGSIEFHSIGQNATTQKADAVFRSIRVFPPRHPFEIGLGRGVPKTVSGAQSTLREGERPREPPVCDRRPGTVRGPYWTHIRIWFADSDGRRRHPRRRFLVCESTLAARQEPRPPVERIAPRPRVLPLYAHWFRLRSFEAARAIIPTRVQRSLPVRRDATTVRSHSEYRIPGRNRRHGRANVLVSRQCAIARQKPSAGQPSASNRI